VFNVSQVITLRKLSCLAYVSKDNIVGIMTGLWDGQSRVKIWQEQEIFLQNVQTSFGAYPASYSLGSGFFLCRLMWLGHDVNHSRPSNVEVKNEWSCTPTFCIYLYGVDRDSFIFYLHNLMITET
jgi:hypothetical protein